MTEVTKITIRNTFDAHIAALDAFQLYQIKYLQVVQDDKIVFLAVLDIIEYRLIKRKLDELVGVDFLSCKAINI